MFAFRGIRFAAPPVDELRWRPPEEPACKSSGVFAADENGQVCSQRNRASSGSHIVRIDTLLEVVVAVLALLALLGMYVLWKRRVKEQRELSERELSHGSEYTIEREGEDAGTVSVEDRPERLESSAMFEDLPEESSRRQAICSTARLVLSSCLIVVLLLVAVLLLVFDVRHNDALQPMIGGEDCLFLNVYSPISALGSESKALDNSSASLPVLVFVHGGDLTHSSGTDSGPESSGGSWALPATGRAVAVQINYRLGVMGFLYLEVEGAPVFPNSTNLGLLDVLAALRWVQAHISAFGGDPERVTVYGQSSGGTAVLSLLASPMAVGLFQRAYAMSASPRVDVTPGEAAVQWRQMFLPDVKQCKEFTRHADLARCLRSLSAAEVVRTTLFSDFLDPSWIWDLATTKKPDPVIELVVADGRTVLGNVSEVLAESSAPLPRVPTIIGTMREEVDRDFTKNAAWPFVRENVVQWATDMCDCTALGPETWRLYEPSEDTPARQRWSQLTTDFRFTCGNLHCARQLSRGQDAPVYSYIFTHPYTRSRGRFPRLPGGSSYAFHSWDLGMLANATDGYSSLGISGYSFAADDYRVANRFRDAILEFAEDGRISSWTPVTANVPVVCEIGNETICAENPRREQCQLFEDCDVSFSNWLVN